MKKQLLILFISLIPTIVFATKNDAIVMIKNDLKNFAISWNQGNIQEIINHYKEANSTTLIWSEITRGYPNIADYLQKNYSSTNNMGTLTTSHVEIKLLSSRYALVTGNWLN